MLRNKGTEHDDSIRPVRFLQCTAKSLLQKRQIQFRIFLKSFIHILLDFHIFFSKIYLQNTVKLISDKIDQYFRIGIGMENIAFLYQFIFYFLKILNNAVMDNG